MKHKFSPLIGSAIIGAILGAICTLGGQFQFGIGNLGVAIGCFLTLLISGFVKEIIQGSISTAVENVVEPAKENRAFRIVFGSPEAVGTVVVMIIGVHTTDNRR